MLFYSGLFNFQEAGDMHTNSESYVLLLSGNKEMPCG